MWRYIVFFFCFASVLEEYSANDFCASLNPQGIINVPQLMGMWYVVEKIDHLDERHYSRQSYTCPIIHISDDEPPTTVNPLYGGNQFRGYGQGYGYGRDGYQYGKTQEQFNRDGERRVKQNREHIYHPKQQPEVAERHYLRIHWDEESESGTTEYHVWFNVTMPGFWISFGPENGAALRRPFSHYAGNIQVIKVVRDHMVLTFCHLLPRQYHSVVLSRQPKLDPLEKLSVHEMLNRRDMKTSAVEKLCASSASKFTSSSYLGLLLMIISVYGIVK